MTNQEIKDRINTFLIEEFEVNPAVIKPDAQLKETVDLDSLDYVDLVVVLESNFGIKVSGEDFKTILTFDDFYNYVIEKIANKQ